MEQGVTFSASKGNRPVWVINTSKRAYKEVFRGGMVTIPPNGEKEVTMPFLEARRFLGQPSAPVEEFYPDGTYKTGGKPLMTVELTEAELVQRGMSKKALAERDKRDNEKAKLACSVCGHQAGSDKGLKIHMTKVHPDMSPVEDE